MDLVTFSSMIQIKRTKTIHLFAILYIVIQACLRTANALSIPSSFPFQNTPTTRLTKYNHDTFETWVNMRVGLSSSDSVFWTGEGQLHESPSGKVLANFDGFDVSKGIRISEDHVRQFSRKIFWFRDPDTNELLTEYNGKPVKPIKYDWQVFDYKRGTFENGMIGDDPGMTPIIPTIVRGPRKTPCFPVMPRYAGSNLMLFQVPLFIDIQTSQGKYQAWEFYDYTVDMIDNIGSNYQRPPTVAWSRQGGNPPFVEDGESGVMHFHGQRVNKFEELPEHMQRLVEKEYNLFRAPPFDMAEVNLLEEKMMNKMMAVATNGSS